MTDTGDERAVFDPTGVGVRNVTRHAPSQLDIATSGGPTTPTVHVRGELLQETALAFTDVVNALGDDTGVVHLVVDLSPTTFMDSTGLGALLTLRNQVTARGARFELVRPDDRVFRLFELTNLDSVFEFVEAS